MFAEKSCSRAIVAFDSSRNVGKMWKTSASASSREAVASKVWFEVSIRLRSVPWRSEIALKTTPVFLIRWRTAVLLLVEHLEQVGAVGGEAGEVAERVVQILAAAVLDRVASSSLTHCANARRVGWSNAS